MTDKELQDYPFPPLPWVMDDTPYGEQGFISRYGAEKAEELYCKIAVDLGYFNPKTEPNNYAPALDPTPFLKYINKANKQER